MSDDNGGQRMRQGRMSVSGWPCNWRPYGVLISGFLMMSCCWGLIMSYGVFFEIYDHDLLRRVPDADLSLIGGTQSFLVLVLSLVVGCLLDARKHQWIAVTGVILLFSGLIALSFAGHNYILVWLSSAFVAGLGMSCFFMYSSQNAIEWFPQEKFFATGLVSAGGPAGGVAFPPLFTFLVARFGFSNGVRILAGIVGSLSLIACFLGPPNPEVKSRRLGPILKISTWIKIAALKTLPYNLYSASMWFTFSGYYPIAYHLVKWVESKGPLHRFDRFWFLAMLNGSNLVGRIGVGVIANKWGKPVFIHALASSIASIFAAYFWNFSSNEVSVIAFCLLFGLAAGSTSALPGASVSEILPREHSSSLGAWTGMMWTSCAVFSFLGPFAAGKLEQSFGLNAVGYWAASNLFMASALQFSAFLVMANKRNEMATTENISLRG